MKKRNLINYLGILGIISFISYLAAVIFSPLSYPGYNWLSQAVSDLSADGAPSLKAWNSIASLYNSFSVGFMLVLSVFVYKTNLNKTLKLGIYIYTLMSIISSVGYKMFPLSEAGYANTFQDIMHVYVVTFLVVILSIVGLILMIIGGYKKGGSKFIFISSIICLALMMIGAIISNIVPKSIFGLFERFSTLSGTLVLALLGIWLFNYKNQEN